MTSDKAMKILDRYVLFTFLKNYLISFMVLIGLYIVLDMVFNFDELAEVSSKTAGAGGFASMLSMLSSIGDYYFYQTFRIFAQLSGIIPVVAAAFTLIRLSRFNEMTASLAAGVPLLRTAMPIIIAAVVLNVLLVVDQEMLVPQMIPKLVRKHDELQQTASKSYPVRAMQDGANGLLNAAEYHPDAQPWMEQVDIVQFDDSFMPVSHIAADRADWDESGAAWRLTNGRITRGLRPGRQHSQPAPFGSYKSSINPEEIALYRSGEFVDLLSRSRIKQLLDRPKSYGTMDLLRVLHSRIAQPMWNIVLLLLAIACIMSREPGRLKAGIFQCVVMCGICMAGIFLTQQLAGTPPGGPQWADRWPALMAWMPIIVFGPVAIGLLERVKT
jgi:lipopolysaccharide export system permease protein